MVALMAALCPGPVLAGLASSCLRHTPREFSHLLTEYGKKEPSQVAKFIPFSSGIPNQYFNSPPLLVASACDFSSSSPSWMRFVLGGT